MTSKADIEGDSLQVLFVICDVLYCVGMELLKIQLLQNIDGQHLFRFLFFFPAFINNCHILSPWQIEHFYFVVLLWPKSDREITLSYFY